MASGNKWLRRLQLELAWFTGQPWLRGPKAGGAGVILRFERVRPARSEAFQPLQSHEITPEFLDRTIAALKRWNFDLIGMDEVCRRAVTLPELRRFVCLSFDGAYRDLMTFGYPILSRHAVPFTVYVPTAFPDGIGEPWWLVLEKVIAREGRVDLIIGGRDQHFTIRTTSDKHELYTYLERWMRSLAPGELSAAVNDLCKRYSVDLRQLSRETFMDWADLARLAADPLVTIASATVNYPVLANLKDTAAAREMAMGKAVAETAFGRGIRHFAYPFGDRAAFRRSHVLMAEQAGFASAVSTIPGVVDTHGRTNLRALPRIAWDGRVGSLRLMRVLLSGVVFPPVKPRLNA
ncbi:MAG: polysaccharide deacetylase family protein [Bradyrhizobium sp.]|uniref:polysaccharide deacetylase family protein n=1 Tax=Bradyrhizobium sp. TaxID=376 RepID=UPI0025C5A606|nr:polysaccharide deacetylase family protein [Bradyrhizobium sp.]MBI5264798.1 polysaccharide deacetylase family protein [Bradyrhizobium sp.]